MQHLSAVISPVARAIGSRRVNGPSVLAVVVTATALLAQPLSAQEKYPNKPIKFVVAFLPGGITDIIARLIGEKLSDGSDRRSSSTTKVAPVVRSVPGSCRVRNPTVTPFS